MQGTALDPLFIFLGQVLLFWSVWKLLDHTVLPLFRRFKKPEPVIQPEPVPEPKKAPAVKKPRKPRAKKVKEEDKILMPEADSIILIPAEEFKPVEESRSNYQ